MTGIVDGRRKSPNRAIIGPIEVHIIEILFALLSDKTLCTRIQIRKKVRRSLHDVSDEEFCAAYNELSRYSRRFRRVLFSIMHKETNI
ncbi:MAG TPA: hypothetical protein VED16_00530 [Candidatus Acidoferrum sp.]|nr:hypothetical protein [Candidatus Acidoferrum sp.]